MKKVLLTVALVIAMGLGANAQQSDNFFKNWDDVDNGLVTRETTTMPNLVGEHGNPGDVGAPLGSGLLILTALGAGYALKNRR